MDQASEWDSGSFAYLFVSDSENTEMWYPFEMGTVLIWEIGSRVSFIYSFNHSVIQMTNMYAFFFFFSNNS